MATKSTKGTKRKSQTKGWRGDFTLVVRSLGHFYFVSFVLFVAIRICCSEMLGRNLLRPSFQSKVSFRSRGMIPPAMQMH
jgi:hypothetical protein